MHPHYGVGTSTEPIVISDDEDEAAFVEFTLEQRISSPTDSVDYDAYHNAGWQQEQPVYVEDDSIPENATGTSLYPPEDEVGQKRKRANSINSAEGQSSETRPSRRAVSPNAPPGESRQGRKKRRKRERQAAEAAKMNGSTPLPLPSSSQSYQPPKNQQVKPTFPLPPKPVPVLGPPQPLFVPQLLPPSTYLHSPISPSLPKPPVRPYDLGWAQFPPRPPVEPLPTIPAPHPVSRVGLPPPDNLQLPKKTIGMPPDSDPHSQHGVYILPSHYQWKPNPARSLVIELLPKRFRTLGFVLEWAGTVCPPGTPPRVELDARIGKALIEFPSADIARTAWESPRLYGGGQEHIRAYWYRLPGIGVDAGVGELEEGEIEDGELVNGASVKVNGQKRRKNRAVSITTSVASTSTFSNAFSVPFSPSPLPSASSTTSVTFTDGKWRSKSIVQAEEPPTTPSLPPGARWVYQDGRWVIQYLRSSLEPDHLPPPISLSAFVDPQEALAETDLNRMNEEGALDPDSDEALLKLTRGEPVVFTDGRRFPAQARDNNSLNHNHLPPSVTLSALAEPFYPTTQSGPSLMQSDSAPSFNHEEAKRPRNGKQAVPLNRNRSLVSEEWMEIASEDGDIYSSITSIGSSFAIGPPEAYPELSPRAYIAALTGSNERPHHMRASNNGQEKSVDSDSDMTGALGLLYPDEPSPRMPVHAPLPRLPAKSASHIVSGSALIRSSTPSPSPSATAPYSNKPLPVDVTLNASNTRSASTSTSTPPTGQDRAQDLKQTLLARQKELEEAITKTKDAMAAKMAAPRSETATPTASEVPVESFEEIPGLTASSTSTLTPATKALKLEPDTSAKARNTAKEDELRRLVLNSKRSRVVGKVSRQPQPSSPAGPSTTQEVKPVAVVSETTTTTTTTTEVTTTKSEVDLDSLAASFIAETIQTVSGPSRADKSASPPPPMSAARSGPNIVLPPSSVSASAALDSLASVSSGYQAMSEIERLVYKEKLLGRKIAESKMYMEQYTNAPTKALKKEIRQKMDERMRMYDEQMKSLETSKPQSKNSMKTNTRVQLHNSAASNSRGPTPGFTNGYAHSHMYGNGGRQSPWWPETNEAMIIDISDEESGEEEE